MLKLPNRDEDIATLRSLISEVLDSGVEFEDERIRYKSIQVAREWFTDARKALDRIK